MMNASCVFGAHGHQTEDKRKSANKTNSAKRLQKEHFNCMVYAALVTLLQHVLSKFNTTNSLACIICSFENLEYLRVLAEVMHRGEMFEFGEESYDQDNPRMIRNLDQEKLKNASVNNMDSERAVASVNYGLKIMGAQEIKAVSSSPVKTKAVDLMDGRRLRPFTKPEQVEEFLKSPDLDDITKNKRLC
eukprot:Em0019g1200a